MAFEEAAKGAVTAMVCSGDAGIYGMAGLMYEIGEEYPEVAIEVIPGVTAALGGSAVLGAAVGHDVSLISLSDLLTPWELIEERLRCAAKADFVICLYNPSSRKRSTYLAKACEIMLEYKGGRYRLRNSEKHCPRGRNNADTDTERIKRDNSRYVLYCIYRK